MFQLRYFLTFCNIQIEEVTVENSLDAASHDGNQIKESLKVVTVDPVENVEGAVGAEGKQVVAGDRLGLARLADHEELRQDGHRLQVDGERPQDLRGDTGHIDDLVQDCSNSSVLAMELL